MGGVLISTIFEKSDSTRLSIREFNIHKMFLLIDKEAKDIQLQSIDLIKKAFGNTIEIIENKVELYDIVSVAEDAVKIIDSIPVTDKICVDISQGRKLQALGLLFASYARASRIESIVYWGDDKKMTILPKLTFKIKEDEKKILRGIETTNITNFIKSMGISRSKLYRLIKNLEKKEMIKKESDKYILTDTGKISLL